MRPPRSQLEQGALVISGVDGAMDAIAIALPAKADDPPVPAGYPVPKRFRKARRAACAGLALALALVGLLAVDIFLTNPRRGATEPHDLELFLNRVSLSPAHVAPLGNAILLIKLPD